VRSAVVVIVARDASTDQRFAECVCVCVSLWDICLCRGPSRTPVHHVCCNVPPSRSWSFCFKLSFRSLAFRVCMCLCVRVCVRVLPQMRLWACLSHVSTYRCAVRFSFSAAAAPAHTSAPAGFFSASCVKTPARHTSMEKRRVGWSQFTLMVIVC
jgi:hypothetical protein